jgi:hypothetical protein
MGRNYHSRNQSQEKIGSADYGRCNADSESTALNIILPLNDPRPNVFLKNSYFNKSSQNTVSLYMKRKLLTRKTLNHFFFDENKRIKTASKPVLQPQKSVQDFSLETTKLYVSKPTNDNTTQFSRTNPKFLPQNKQPTRNSIDQIPIQSSIDHTPKW